MVNTKRKEVLIQVLDLFVLDTASEERISVTVAPATEDDFKNTHTWQTDWTSAAAQEMPNKVALRRTDNRELLGLMSYLLDERGLAVELIYLESARHSNANMLGNNESKKYIGIARALFAYAIEVSMNAGFGGVLVFKAKTSELLEYYMHAFKAKQVSSYDPFRLVIWEDAAERIIADYRRDDNV